MKSPCILCVTTSDEILHIFDENGLRLNINSIITKHFWVKPSIEDCNANVICCSCWNALNSFHKFYQDVAEAHAKLECVKRSIEDEESTSVNFESFYNLFTSEIPSETSQDSKGNLVHFIPQVPVVLVQQESITQSDAVVQQVKSESHDKLIGLSHKAPTIEDQICSNDEDSEASTNEEEQQNESTTDDYSEYGSPKSKRQLRTSNPNAKMSQEKRISCKDFDEIIKQNMKLICEICYEPMASFSALKEHCRLAHNEVAYATCCEKKYNSRHALVHHILLHQNPDAFKCQTCGRIMANKKSLKHHIQTHLNKARIYDCNKCKKSFSSEEKLERHMQTHEKIEQICEQCGKVCRDKHALRLHKLREHSDVPKQRLQCQKCGAYLADSSTLYTHMKYQHPKTDVVYKCDICGKISTTGYGLKRHKLYMHKYERCHKCTMCEKGFKTAQRLREHMTTHTGEVLYTCPHCPKTFNSNANMHSHRKKMHRKEWEENRRHPHMGSSSNAE